MTGVSIRRGDTVTQTCRRGGHVTRESETVKGCWSYEELEGARKFLPLACRGNVALQTPGSDGWPPGL
jgi:hypothetical protein